MLSEVINLSSNMESERIGFAKISAYWTSKKARRRYTSLSKRKCYIFHCKKAFLHYWQHGNIVIPVGIDPAPAWPSLSLFL